MPHPTQLYGEPDLKIAGLSIWAISREFPQSDDYWDGNWLVSPITVRVKDFAAKVAAGLRAEEIRRFRLELEQLEQAVDGGGPALLVQWKTGSPSR